MVLTAAVDDVVRCRPGRPASRRPLGMGQAAAVTPGTDTAEEIP
jgi:hypothetical protein